MEGNYNLSPLSSLATGPRIIHTQMFDPNFSRNLPFFSLVPIRCYGHHGPAVRRGLKTHRKLVGEGHRTAWHVRIPLLVV
jgi:hypothetical protein